MDGRAKDGGCAATTSTWWLTALGAGAIVGSSAAAALPAKGHSESAACADRLPAPAAPDSPAPA
jgi:hypothetical protein